jgi:hypothetical protein
MSGDEKRDLMGVRVCILGVAYAGVGSELILPGGLECAMGLHV